MAEIISERHTVVTVDYTIMLNSEEYQCILACLGGISDGKVSGSLDLYNKFLEYQM